MTSTLVNANLRYRILAISTPDRYKTSLPLGLTRRRFHESPKRQVLPIPTNTSWLSIEAERFNHAMNHAFRSPMWLHPGRLSPGDDECIPERGRLGPFRRLAG